MHVTIRLFARLRELAGASELDRDVPEGSAASDIWRTLAGEFPALKDYTGAISVAINEDYARMSAAVRDGDEVAFLPPVSGG